MGRIEEIRARHDEDELHGLSEAYHDGLVEEARLAHADRGVLLAEVERLHVMERDLVATAATDPDGLCGTYARNVLAACAPTAEPTP